MMHQFSQTPPPTYLQIDQYTREVGFTMPSDKATCGLLKTLAASKKKGRFLELGTGTGLSTAWILEGMDAASSLISIDNDQKMQDIAEKFLSEDPRLTLFNTDGAAWIDANKGLVFDYVFADTWPGKYFQLDEVLNMLSEGGLYIIDDMLPQPNWPEGHAEKAGALIQYLESRTDLVVTKLDWATGIILGVKI